MSVSYNFYHNCIFLTTWQKCHTAYELAKSLSHSLHNCVFMTDKLLTDYISEYWTEVSTDLTIVYLCIFDRSVDRVRACWSVPHCWGGGGCCRSGGRSASHHLAIWTRSLVWSVSISKAVFYMDTLVWYKPARQYFNWWNITSSNNSHKCRNVGLITWSIPCVWIMEHFFFTGTRFQGFLGYLRCKVGLFFRLLLATVNAVSFTENILFAFKNEEEMKY